MAKGVSTANDVDIVKGEVLYDDSTHRFVWIGWEEADQTNLLALNAAIEAARVGDGEVDKISEIITAFEQDIRAIRSKWLSSKNLRRNDEVAN